MDARQTAFEEGKAAKAAGRTFKYDSPCPYTYDNFPGMSITDFRRTKRDLLYAWFDGYHGRRIAAPRIPHRRHGSMNKDKQIFKSLKRRADEARDFPTNTDPCSRHAYIMAEAMTMKRGYPMLAEEPMHCAISIMATVAALWEARAKLGVKMDPAEPGETA